MIILGIDPGTTRAGFGLIKKTNSVLSFVAGGILATTSPDPAYRLHELTVSLEKIITKHKPDRVGIEKLFFAKNQKTALSVAEARGVILATFAKYNLPITEFAPNEVKQFLTGSGSSNK